jgi:hypothetical protein
MFPEQLADQPLIRVGYRSKVPVVDCYEVEPTNSVVNWVQMGNNAGICLSDTSYVVIDADTMQVASEVHDRLPDTFLVSTGGEGFGQHYYFKCAEWGENKLFSDGDSGIKTDGGFTVIPPSVTEGRYTVRRDLPVAEVSVGQIRELVECCTEDSDTDTSAPVQRDRGRVDSGELEELDELIHHDEKRADVRAALVDPLATHNQRQFVAGFLHDVVGLSHSEIVELIDRLNRWDNYDREITERQVQSVIESSGGGR